jgi:hypothetical protein
MFVKISTFRYNPSLVSNSGVMTYLLNAYQGPWPIAILKALPPSAPLPPKFCFLIMLWLKTSSWDNKHEDILVIGKTFLHRKDFTSKLLRPRGLGGSGSYMDSVTRFSIPVFHQTIPQGPILNGLTFFHIWLRLCRDIQVLHVNEH